jgi:hydroxymethylglutaryl-CoA reductase (NADPH)
MQLPFLPAFTMRKPPPQWDPFTPAFSRLSRSACTHPIHTIVIIALLASTTYVSMLENSLFDKSFSAWSYASPRRADLMDGHVEVAVNEATAWQWQENVADMPEDVQHLALVSLKFPEHALETLSPIFPDTSARELESEDPLTKVYAVEYSQLNDFIGSVKSVAAAADDADAEQRQWILQVGQSRGNKGGYGIVGRVTEAAQNIWDMVKVRARHFTCSWIIFLTRFPRMPIPSMLPSCSWDMFRCTSRSCPCLSQ